MARFMLILGVEKGRPMEARMLHPRFRQAHAFTLVEIMIVVAIIGMLAAIAIPAFSKCRTKSQTEVCKQKQRVILDAINVYCMDNFMGMSPAEWPNLCAARNRLAPGGSHVYVKDWDVFECPVPDSQNQHDFAYVFTDGVMTDLRCNNSDSSVRVIHNE